MDYFMIFLIFLIILFIYLIYQKDNEHFTISNYLFINDLQHDEHQDIIINNSNENKILSNRDNNLIPTYALYQPEVSGRHLNFFSHAPKEIPYFPNQIWSSTIQDPYYQPAYSNYFYNDGYFYPLF
jgi:hypothetical protein